MSKHRLVQYIIVSSDLKNLLNRPLGTIIGQCCQAVTAVAHKYQNDMESIHFAKNAYAESKNVVVEANGEIELLLLTEKLIKDGIKHDIWFDEKTTTATCIALKPYNQQTVPEYIKALKLFE